MMLLDDRESDLNFLRPALRDLGIQSDVTRLDYGDACFLGLGPGGDCSVGIERKKIPDLIHSMQDRRLSGHQLRGMYQTYDFCFLLIEGMWRAGDHGAVETFNGAAKSPWQPYYTRLGGGTKTWRGQAVSFRQLMNYLTTLELCGHVKLRFASTQWQTAHLYASLYYWFTEKPWEDHASCNEIYAKGQGPRRDITGSASALAGGNKPHFARLVAMQIPGIDGRERHVVKRFSTAREMANATLAEWVSLPWVTKTGKPRRLGPVVGKKAFEAWNSRVEGL